MKIGILTFHQSVNNGAVMQAYALSHRIQKEYPACEVEIVDYQMKKVQAKYAYSLWGYLFPSTPVRLVKKLLYLVRHPLYLWRNRKRTSVFSACLNELPLSPDRILSDVTNEVFEYVNARYDILIVGSDAVWNYVARGFGNAYLPNCSVSCKKFSYAASCYGMDFLKRPDSERRKIQEWLNDFAFVGVRDGATEDFVKWTECNAMPVHTCDPTVFLDVNDLPIDEVLLHEKLEKRGFDFSRPTIGMMGSQKMLGMIRKMYGKRYQIVALYEYISGADVNLYDLKPYEWAYVFRLFKMTFTTYFHGTLLSLRNGTPVICIALDTEFAKVHTPKTLDVLTRLGFSHWYFKTDYRSENYEVIKKQADDFLKRDYHAQIVTAMDEEAKSFDHFNNVLKDYI